MDFPKTPGSAKLEQSVNNVNRVTLIWAKNVKANIRKMIFVDFCDFFITYVWLCEEFYFKVSLNWFSEKQNVRNNIYI